LEHERRKKIYARTEFQPEVDRAGGINEKTEVNKNVKATNTDNTNHIQKKKAKPKSQGSSAKPNNADTTKKAKELGEELVTYAIKKASMASSHYNKCDNLNHITKLYTNAGNRPRRRKRRPKRKRRRPRWCLE